MKRNISIATAVVALALSFDLKTLVEESPIEKAETSKDKVVDSAKSTYRKVDDKICETVNGKINCVSKRIRNAIKDTSDKIKANATDVINRAG